MIIKDLHGNQARAGVPFFFCQIIFSTKAFLSGPELHLLPFVLSYGPKKKKMNARILCGRKRKK
jgi:hypothetical protein